MRGEPRYSVRRVSPIFIVLRMSSHSCQPTHPLDAKCPNHFIPILIHPIPIPSPIPLLIPIPIPSPIPSPSPTNPLCFRPEKTAAARLAHSFLSHISYHN